jgi:hypothetical protein
VAPNLVDPDKYRPEEQELVWLANQHIRLAYRLDQDRQAILDKYNTGDHGFDRWGWLAARRALIRDADRASREVAGLERAFWKEYAACLSDQKDWLKDRGEDMARFHERRLRYRYDWYYTARGHSWRWERERPCLNYRVFGGACKRLGITTEEGGRALAWVDLLATDLLPAHMSQWLTIPMSLMSGPPPGRP